MEKPATLPLTDADWQQTPITVQALIVALWDEVQQLRSEVVSLREQVQQTSHNSSRPPSSDLPSTPARKRGGSGRSAGGQPGHKGWGRTLLPHRTSGSCYCPQALHLHVVWRYLGRG